MAAPADEGRGHPVPGTPVPYLTADSCDRAGKFMPGHVRQHDFGVMTHPAMPVAAAKPGSLDLDHDTMRRGNRIGASLTLGGFPNCSYTTALIAIPLPAAQTWCLNLAAALISPAPSSWCIVDWARRHSHGAVVVGDLIGEGAAQEEAVIDDMPNLAARVQALAEPGWW